MINKTDYSYDVQKLYLEMFLSDAETFMRCQNIFDPQNFDRRLYEASAFMADYVDKYKIMPESSIINASCKIDFQPANLPKENYDWLLEEFERFSRHKALERAILQSADLLEKGEYGPVEKMIKDAVQVGLTKDMGTDYFEDPRARLLKLRDNNGQISTGYLSIDRKLFGGFNRGELNIFAAGSGGGKSLFLANLGVNWATAGLNVVYITFELSEMLVAMRLDSMITGIASREIFKNLDDVELKVKVAGKKSGNIQIKYMPSGKNCNDVRTYLKEYRIKKGYDPDALLIDYLDLMMPVNIKVSPSDLYVKDKYVSEELRNLAVELNTVLASASQLNRCLALDTIVDINGTAQLISNVKIGDQLSSNNGPVTVIEILPIIKQQIYEITTKSGKKIRCSSKHLFPSDLGLRNIQNGLSIGNKLYINSLENKTKISDSDFKKRTSEII
jgi:archaellum biogenesis ATPase FlaH